MSPSLAHGTSSPALSIAQDRGFRAANPVNCYGKMGRGLALEFKRRFPKMFKAYKRACDEKKVCVGKMHLWKSPNGLWIVNFPTKDHWRQPSQMQWIVDGLKDLGAVLKEKQIGSIAIPPLGCGLGLHWYQVRAEIKKAHENFFPLVRTVVYEP